MITKCNPKRAVCQWHRPGMYTEGPASVYIYRRFQHRLDCQWRGPGIHTEVPALLSASVVMQKGQPRNIQHSCQSLSRGPWGIICNTQSCHSIIPALAQSMFHLWPKVNIDLNKEKTPSLTATQGKVGFKNPTFQTYTKSVPTSRT